MNTIIECPKCKCQIELRASFASGPKKSSGEETSGVGALLDAIDISTLSGRDLDFVEKTKERFEKYGDRIMMTEKQIKYLKDISERAGF